MLRLEPGGQARLNPLTRVGTPQMRESLLQAVAHAMLARPLRQVEAVGLVEALTAADELHSGEVCVGHVVEQLRDPAERTIAALDLSREAAREELREVALALMRLCHGPLRGMFDAPTSHGEEVWDAPVICLDISSVAAGSSGSDLALAITMVCATAFLDARRVQRALRSRACRCRAAEDDPRKRRGMAGAADRGARRLLPGRVQARTPDRRAALDGAAPPL